MTRRHCEGFAKGLKPLATDNGIRHICNMEHRLDVIDRTVSKTWEWINRISAGADVPDPHHAYQLLRSVLDTLRDRVEPDMAAHVAAQLPLLVRGIFYEGWDPSKTPVRMSLKQFLSRVQRDAGLQSPQQAETGARAVISLCWDELGPGTMDHLMSVLSNDFAVIF